MRVLATQLCPTLWDSLVKLHVITFLKIPYIILPFYYCDKISIKTMDSLFALKLFENTPNIFKTWNIDISILSDI